MDLDLELHRRNARLRAWQACGLPLVGGWRQAWSGRWIFAVRCTATCCSESITCTSFNASEEPPAAFEARALTGEGFGWRPTCVHLSPLLREDPPEVQALWELELLAGAP